MTEQTEKPPETGEGSSKNNWQEVGRQFQALGESLAEAVRAAWQNEETQRTVQEMRTGLENMVRDVGKAIDDSAKTPQGQKIRQNAERAAESLRGATEQTAQEVRPQLINALEQVNSELQKLITRMQSSDSAPENSTAEKGPDSNQAP